VRSVLLHYLRELPCEAEVVVARKIAALFEKQHHAKEEEFYADLLAHLIKNRLKRPGTLVLNIAERGSSTREKVLIAALQLAKERAGKKWGESSLQTRIVFNIQNSRTEPLLTVSDYLCSAGPSNGSLNRAKCATIIISSKKFASLWTFTIAIDIKDRKIIMTETIR
jgi:hypothetical protein